MSSIYIGSYNKVKSNSNKYNFISITNSVPDGFKSVQKYGKLTPDWRLEKQLNDGDITPEQFSNEFKKQLSKLNPRKISKSIKDKNKPTVLLINNNKIWECHGDVILNWFNSANIIVEKL